jgi:dihydroorotase
MSHAGDDDAAEQATCRDRVGAIADVSVLSDDRGRFILHDNEKTEVVAERLLQPLFCLRAGQRYDADAATLPQAIAA